MRKSSEEILADIDQTLDQLIRNNYKLKEISDTQAFMSCSARMHKMQVSLAARVVHSQKLLDTPDLAEEKIAPIYETIQQKIAEYKKLNNQMLDVISKKFRPRIGRNRKK